MGDGAPSELEEKLDPQYNLSAGTIRFYPTVGAHLALTKHMAVALLGSYYQLSESGVTATLYGGLITANYYGSATFQGLSGSTRWRVLFREYDLSRNQRHPRRLRGLGNDWLAIS